MKQSQAAVSNVEFHNYHPSAGDNRRELMAGLGQQQKTINPKYFYDARGSELFDRITALPEYYPTRTEMAILRDNCEEMAACCGAECVLIEPGSGSCEKVRLLLDALRPRAYVPLDISADFLSEAAMRLGREYPWLRVQAICADFSHDWLGNASLPQGRRVVFYPGSTIGNLEPAAAVGFLQRLREWMGPDGGALIGVDLHKSEQRLNLAYNDAAGVTADFNLNVLERVNSLLDADFDRERFSHQAFYNIDRQRIEMHLVSDRAQQVRCNGDLLEFREGETIHTENSYKYTVNGFGELAAQAGLRIRRSWLDEEQLFSVHYLET